MEVRHINRSSSATRQPKVDTSTICVSGDAPARQDVPFDADCCHQLRVSRIAETTSFTPETRQNASRCLEPC